MSVFSLSVLPRFIPGLPGLKAEDAAYRLSNRGLSSSAESKKRSMKAALGRLARTGPAGKACCGRCGCRRAGHGVLV